MNFRGTSLSLLLSAGFVTTCLAFLWPGGEARAEQLSLTYDYFGHAESAGRFYLPIPPDTSCQRIESFQSSWSGDEIREESVPAQRWLAGPVPQAGGLHWRVRIVGEFSREPMVRSAASPSGGFEGTSAALDWDSPDFQDWLDRHRLRRSADEGASTFARRVYDFLVLHGDYTYPPSGGWTASAAARRLQTDCGGFSLVFVAACRANRIPARLLVGQWLKTGAEGGDVIGRQAHVMAEFYDPAAGWRPVDVYAGVARMAGSDDYFGRQPGYFFTWHFDTDYQFDGPPGANGHVQWIQNPSPWFADESGENGSHCWTIESLP